MRSSKNILFLIILGFTLTSLCKEMVSPLKKELTNCFKEDFSTSKANSLKKIYVELDKKYQLVSTTLIQRETEFKEKDDTKKLRYGDEKLSLFKVKDDGTMNVVDYDTRQKDRTIEATMSQLLVHANIVSDWTKTKEVRTSHHELTVVRSNGEIKSLQIEKTTQKKQLFCLREEGKEGTQDICSCHESK